jgi:hypothetical protein
MNAKLWAPALGAVLLFSSFTFAQEERSNSKMSEDMRQAIAFQRNKDAADARQARIEAGRLGVSDADRSSEEPKPPRKVKNSKKPDAPRAK